MLRIALLAASSIALAPDEPPPAVIAPRVALALPPAGQGGRALVAVDPVQAEIVAGRWAAPKAGDEAGPGRAWAEIRARDDGSFQPRGGYVAVDVPSDADRVMILEASGHGVAYAGGAPRMGNPYGYDYVHLPVHLDRGSNSLLFGAGRGSLRVKLVTPRAPAMIDAADPTLPDLVGGRAVDEVGAVVVLNASTAPLAGASLSADVAGAPAVVSPVPTIPPLGTRKVPFRIRCGPPAEGPGRARVALTLRLAGAEAAVDSAELPLEVVRPESTQKRTFVSAIDGSVQYFGLVPASVEGRDGREPGLILTLHGASVEGIGQARVYKPRPWAHVVAPTNRRPYGFDWEDWGRLDAVEVLDRAIAALGPDPRRVYLTGHSMGGHGTWHLGATFPDRFAAIAPSAGWVSMASYAGVRRPDDGDPVAALIARAGLPGDTLALSKNYGREGVYVLHGDADDNVPVAQARSMRAALGEFHADFAYYERRGAGHWWGDECCDWPPLMDFLARRERPEPRSIRRVDFLTAHPGVSARCDWATVEAQVSPFERSAVHLESDPDARSISGTTENVARLALDLAHLKPGGAPRLTIDGKAVEGVGESPRVWLARSGDDWRRVDEPSKSSKGPHRAGPFKDAFRNRFALVYGTRGTPEEDAWALAKARFDAETFYYRGNGSVDVVADAAFDPRSEPDRSVILYGNAETNAAWPALLGGGPVSVRRGGIRVGGRAIDGADLACLFVRPRPGSDLASVAAVSGTGPAGMRLTDRIPYFSSGVPLPDLVVVGADALEVGPKGIRGAGFFGPDWGVESGEFRWR